MMTPLGGADEGLKAIKSLQTSELQNGDECFVVSWIKVDFHAERSPL